MKILDSENSFALRVNFIDKNDVLVGYDYFSSCCENFGWFIDSRINTTINKALVDEHPSNIEEFSFDTGFFQEDVVADTYNEGSFAIFRLVNDKGEALFLHLFNVHNGYYSHGFTMEVGGKVLGVPKYTLYAGSL